jgi:hypothetical protein
MTTRTDRSDSLLVEAARWRLLGLLFERPRAGWHAEVRGLAAEVQDPALEAAAGASAAAGEGEFLATFGPGGAVSPREVAYRPLGDPGKILVALRGFYAAFGYEARAEDPPDHVAVETGFVGFLRLKAAYAAARGDAESALAARRAADTFVAEHLADLASEVARGLTRGGPEHLSLAASVLRDRCPRAARPSALRVVRGPAFDGAACGSQSASDFDCGV